MNKRLILLTCFFSVLTLIFSIVSINLILKSDKVKTEQNSSTVLASNNIYLNTSINYYGNNTLNILSPEPGYSLTQSFSITNNNSNTIKYKIVWREVTSSWNYNSSKKEEFTYSLSCSNGEKIENKTMPFQEETIIENLELKTNKTNDCTITINFLNTGLDQSYNLNNTFKGIYKFEIEK